MTHLSLYPTIPNFRHQRMRQPTHQSINRSSANQPIAHIQSILHSQEPLSLLVQAASLLSPIKASNNQSNNRLLNQSPNRVISQSPNKSVNQHVRLPVRFAAPRLIDEFDSETDSESEFESEDDSDESLSQSIVPNDWNDVSALLSLMDLKDANSQSNIQTTNQSVNQTSNRNNNPTINQIIQHPNQSINQTIDEAMSFHSPLENAIALTLQSMSLSMEQSVNETINESINQLNEEVIEAINDEGISEFINQSKSAYNQFISTRRAQLDQINQSITQSTTQLRNQLQADHQSNSAHLRSKLNELRAIEQSIEKQRREAEEQAKAEARRQKEELAKKQAEEEALKQALKQAEEEKAKQQAEQAAKQSNQQPESTNQSATISTSQTNSTSVRQLTPAELEVAPSITQWQNVKQMASQFTAAGPAKLQIKQSVNRTINQISQTISSVRDKTLVLLNLLNQAKQSNNQPNNPSISPQHAYVVYLIVEKVVNQCSTRIRLERSASFAFAGVLINLIVSDSVFAQCLRGALCEQSIACYPVYYDRKDYPSMAEYKKALGMKEDEAEEEYFARQAAYVSLLAAVMQQEGGDKHPYGIDSAWTWLARMLNMEPRTSTAAVLHSFLQIAAQSLYEKYPNQMRKVFAYLDTVFMPKLQSQAAKTPARKAAYTRLHLWLRQTMNDIATAGKPAVPEGKYMQDRQDQDTNTVYVSAGDEQGV